MGKMPEDINEKFFDDILPWNERRTGKVKIKQAELNMKSEKYQNALKILGM